MNGSIDWDAKTHEILKAIDIRREAEIAGLKITGKDPNPGGWIACHAFDRQDKNPSAAINVASSNGLLGKYKDQGSDEKAIGFFELLARMGRFTNWKAARDYYAKQADVDLPQQGPLAVDQLQPLVWLRDIARLWVEEYKKGILASQLEYYHCQMGFWPANMPRKHHCLVIPAFRDAGEPCGLVLYRLDGQPFEAVEGTSLRERKVHCLKGSKNGWICPSWELLDQAEEVWICEGPPDALALSGLVLFADNTVAITGIFGANESVAQLPWEVLAGKRVKVIPQADVPGQAAARKKAEAARTAGAASVEIVYLPFPVTKNKGKDVRDWINEFHPNLSDLQQLRHETYTGKPSSDVENYTTAIVNNVTVRTVKPLADIVASVHGSRDNWPINIGGQLYVPARNTNKLRPVTKVSELFAWLRADGGQVRWAKSECSDGTPASQEELLVALRENAAAYFEGIGHLPHEPAMANTYYLQQSLPEPTGHHLGELLARLNADTEYDRDLMLAALLTPGWGGPPGSRPLFLITSRHGRGAGKTKTAETIAAIWGGAITGTLNKQEINVFRNRLLDDSALALRCILIDNIKGFAGSGEIEGMITSRTIDGKRMYSGDYRRTNDLTWFFTANVATFSADLTSRAVTINVGPPQSSGFAEWADHFCREHQLNIIADLLAILRGPDKCSIKSTDRWSEWCRAVLSKFENGNELLERIRSVRHEIDADEDQANDVAEVVRDIVAGVRCNGKPIPPEQPIAIPAKLLLDRLRKEWGLIGLPDNKISIRLSDYLNTGPLKGLSKAPGRHYGRCFLWAGNPDATNVITGFTRTIYPWSNEWLEKQNDDYTTNS